MVTRGPVARIGRKVKRGKTPRLTELSKEAKKLMKRGESRSKALSKAEDRSRNLRKDMKAAGGPSKRRRRTLKKRLSRVGMVSTSGALLMYLFDPQLGKQRRARMVEAKEKFLASR